MKNSTGHFGLKTIPQFYICEFINAHFEEGALELELVDRNTIKGTDASGDHLYFIWNETAQEVTTAEEV